MKEKFWKKQNWGFGNKRFNKSNLKFILKPYEGEI
jgi:hypothetical protein